MFFRTIVCAVVTPAIALAVWNYVVLFSVLYDNVTKKDNQKWPRARAQSHCSSCKPLSFFVFGGCYNIIVRVRSAREA